MNKQRFVLALAGIILAAPAAIATALADPPARVGRLSDVEGTVSFHAGDQDQWSPATLNYPVTGGQSYWTEPQSRAEIEVGSAAIRLDESTELDVQALDDGATRLELPRGVLNIAIRALPPGGAQVTTPGGQIDFLAPGSYHVYVPGGDAPPDQFAVTVLQGAAAATTQAGRFDIRAGTTGWIGGGALFNTAAAQSTPFDSWAASRETAQVAPQSAQYLSPEETGYGDLDAAGSWGSDPAYGAVWYPTSMPADWAPYRYGHWAFVAPWGWTWIDDAPWGFTPFHYGRWVQVGPRWAWCPGTRVAHPVYAPALVAFIGGSGFGVAVASSGSQPAISWVPLAPFEVFHPYYRTSVTYVRNVNVTSVRRVDITRITTVKVTNVVTTENFHNHGAATVVAANAFTHAAPVQRAVVNVPHDQLAHEHMAGNLQHLAPSPAAHAGAAVPAAAGPHPPNAPATVQRVSAPGNAPKPGERHDEPAPQHAPGPAFTPRNGHSPATPAAGAQPPKLGAPNPPTHNAPVRPAVANPGQPQVQPPHPPVVNHPAAPTPPQHPPAVNAGAPAHPANKEVDHSKPANAGGPPKGGGEAHGSPPAGGQPKPPPQAGGHAPAKPPENNKKKEPDEHKPNG